MFKGASVLSKEKYTRAVGRRLGYSLNMALGNIPTAAWLFCAPQKGMEDLLRGIRETIETDTLIGCTTDGEISCKGFSTGSAVLGGIRSDRIDFQVVAADGLSRSSEESGKYLAANLPETTRYIQLFSDGLTGNGCALLRGIKSVFGEKMPIAGGAAGDNGQFIQTWQFAGDQVLTDSAVAIGFSGDFHLGTGIHSGWSPIGLAKKVTRASGNILHELNGEPALKVYERFLGKHADKLPAIGVEYPLGLAGEWGDVGEDDYFLLRATMSVNRTEGSISFAGEIPEGAMVHLTCGDTTSILEAAQKAAGLAMADLQEVQPAMLFCYSCMARRIVLGSRTKEEIQRIRQEIGAQVPLLGFYTYGEYCRVKPDSSSLLHNETVTISVIGV